MDDDIDDLFDAKKELNPVSAKWKSLGIALRLKPNILDGIKAENSGDPTACLTSTVTEWLNRNYNVKRFGEPTWRRLVEAVGDPAGGANMALARDMAGRHKAGADHEQAHIYEVGRPVALRGEAWYHAGISREMAEQQLENTPNGYFLVRESETKSGCFSLSLKHPGGIAHFRIEKKDSGLYEIPGTHESFATLLDLINHFKHNSISEHPHYKLISPCDRAALLGVTGSNKPHQHLEDEELKPPERWTLRGIQQQLLQENRAGRANPPVPPARRQQNHSAHTTSTSVAPSATFSPPGSITRSDSPPLPPYNVVTGSNKPPQHLDDDEFEPPEERWTLRDIQQQANRAGRTNPPVPPAQHQQNHSAHTTSTSVAPSTTFNPPGSITRSDSPPLPPYNPQRPPQQGPSSVDKNPPILPQKKATNGSTSPPTNSSPRSTLERARGGGNTTREDIIIEMCSLGYSRSDIVRALAVAGNDYQLARLILKDFGTR